MTKTWTDVSGSLQKELKILQVIFAKMFDCYVGTSTLPLEKIKLLIIVQR